MPSRTYPSVLTWETVQRLVQGSQLVSNNWMMPQLHPQFEHEQLTEDQPTAIMKGTWVTLIANACTGNKKGTYDNDREALREIGRGHLFMSTDDVSRLETEAGDDVEAFAKSIGLKAGMTGFAE